MRFAKTISVSLPAQLAREADRVARLERRSRSELFREAIRRYIDAREERAFRKKVQLAASSLGVRTEDDVERIIDELRT